MGNLEELVQGKLPPEKAPTPLPSPTEQQRAERFLTLLQQEGRLKKAVEDGKGRLDKARAKVAEEEEKLDRVQTELLGVERQIEAYKVEDREREQENCGGEGG